MKKYHLKDFQIRKHLVLMKFFKKRFLRISLHFRKNLENIFFRKSLNVLLLYIFYTLQKNATLTASTELDEDLHSPPTYAIPAASVQ